MTDSKPYILKGNESLHITVKNPPNTVRSLGIFSSIPDSALLPIVEQFLKNEGEPKTAEFTSNVKEEVMKLLFQKEVLSISRSETGVITIKLR